VSGIILAFITVIIIKAGMENGSDRETFLPYEGGME
jgi:hypothetical protein